ncbi:hypothetical protein FQA39_LY09118 [Lamprigera yunnana]|nr:hypothetical protein FQA39_LY09118 [Lamprigera yunnana]
MQRLICILLLVFVSLLSSVDNSAKVSTLKVLHIIFRHGQRTTEAKSTLLYTKNPNKYVKYYPYGYGQLTNQGKRISYALGTWLRRRYDGFLGNVYNPNMLEAVTSSYNRTAATLLLVLAGLFPTKGTILDWNTDLNWQPVFFQSLPLNDILLNFPLDICPKFRQLYFKYLNTTEGRKIAMVYKDLTNYVEQNSGLRLRSLLSVIYVYDVLVTEDEWGLKLPIWTSKLYPNVMNSVFLDGLEAMVATTELKRYASGFLLEKIIKDTKLVISNMAVPLEKNVFIYSAHDFNIMFLQILLGAYTPHRPTYGACFIIEVHLINNVHGIKIFYRTKSEEEPQPLKIVGCDYYCPFKKFYKLVKRYLPTKDMNCNLY